MKRFVIFTFIFTIPALLSAQLSPGKLSAFHKDLEGLKNCTKCHEFGNKQATKKCLTCHTVLKGRIDLKQGLHSNPDYRECNSCHVEHQGREYQLIFWPEGKEAFKHELTGYSLIGKHSAIKCGKCHLPDHIKNQEKFKSEKINLNRTYLGLQTDCINCHEDEHRQQFKQGCLTCHTMDGWQPAVKFNHAKTKFPLTGKHQTVICEKCHPRITDHQFQDNPDFLRFTISEKNRCISCHQDSHQNKFGQNCKRCHSTKGWHSVNNVDFNHDQTSFPLQGKHKSTKCNLCHLPEKPLRGLSYGKCQDCHNDYHEGQFAHRQRKGECEECHTVNGFQPAQFSIADHAKTSYPLQGSHLAIPCNACHKNDNKSKTITFHFTSTKCNVCHRDPHKGEVDLYLKKLGCEYCHFERSWDSIDFDHSKTKFALEGKHQTIKCRECHKKIERGTAGAHIQILGLSVLCGNCHEDVHGGQFQINETDKIVNCERCHSPVNWKANNFNHNRDADFKLEGAHEKLECSQCHKPEKQHNKEIIIYKPLGKQCKSCHSNKIKFKKMTKI